MCFKKYKDYIRLWMPLCYWENGKGPPLYLDLNPDGSSVSSPVLLPKSVPFVLSSWFSHLWKSLVSGRRFQLRAVFNQCIYFYFPWYYKKKPEKQKEQRRSDSVFCLCGSFFFFFFNISTFLYLCLLVLLFLWKCVYVYVWEASVSEGKVCVGKLCVYCDCV